MDSSHKLLSRLLTRGDEVAIKEGRLVITANSGSPVPREWIKKHQNALAEDVLKALDLVAFQYISHSTGRSNGTIEWLDLQFVEIVSRKKGYMTFNVKLDRDRNTAAGEKGTPLPKGHFRAMPGSGLVTFWKLTGLPLPRLAAMHDYLGKLGSILFTGNYIVGEKLDKKSIRMINISCEEIRQALKSGYTRISTDQTPDYPRTISGQLSDNSRTGIPDKNSQQTQRTQYVQPFSSTGQKNCGNTVISKTVLRGKVVTLDPLSNHYEEQSDEEWDISIGDPEVIDFDLGTA